ncbi:MAG: M56 family metallopeptidase, partial [Chthoniobacteraceae bacterium]
MHLHEHFPLLIEIFLKSAVVLLLAAFASAVWRHASAANRHAVWLAALLTLLLLPFTKLASPRWAYVWQRDTAPHRVAAGLPPIVARLALPALREAGSSAGDAHSSESQAVVVDWAGVGVVGWLVGVAFLLIQRVAVRWRLASMVRASRQVNDARMRALIDEIAVGHRTRPEVRESASCCVPLASGVWRPVVLLPTAALSWDEVRLSAALRHEFGHIVRRDCLSRLLLDVASALYWMNPLVWLAARAMRVAQEQACDDSVLRAGASATDYARQLVDVVRELGANRFAARHALAMAQPSTLETRVRAIVDETRDRRPLSRRMTAGAVAAVGIFLGLCGVAQLSGEEKKGPVPLKPTVTAEVQADVRQIEIESKFVELTESAARGAAFSWLPPIPEAGTWDGRPGPRVTSIRRLSPLVDTVSMQGKVIGVFDDKPMQTMIRALNQQRGVDLLSAPRVTTKVAQSAVIEITREIRYPTEYDAYKKPGSWKATAFGTKNAGVTLAVTPTVNAADEIVLDLAPEVVEFEGFRDFDAGGQGAEVVASTKFSARPLVNELEQVPAGHRVQPIFSTRKMDTSVELKAGQTVVLECGTRDDAMVVEEKGAKKPKTMHITRRLIVFVTARFVDPAKAVNAGNAKSFMTAGGKVESETPPTEVLAQKAGGKPNAGDAVPSQTVMEKAGKIILPKVEFRSASIHEAIDFLKKKSVELDPEHKGVNIVLKEPEFGYVGVTLNLANVPLIEAVKYVADLTGLKISTEPFAIILHPPTTSKTVTSPMPT